jgi:hypothetical protein
MSGKGRELWRQDQDWPAQHLLPGFSLIKEKPLYSLLFVIDGPSHSRSNPTVCVYRSYEGNRQPHG